MLLSYLLPCRLDAAVLPAALPYMRSAVSLIGVFCVERPVVVLFSVLMY